MPVQPGLCRTWSETPKTDFLTARLIYCTGSHTAPSMQNKSQKQKTTTPIHVASTAIRHSDYENNICFNDVCTCHKTWVPISTMRNNLSNIWTKAQRIWTSEVTRMVSHSQSDHTKQSLVRYLFKPEVRKKTFSDVERNLGSVVQSVLSLTS